jgi:hypothetical protein
MKAILKRMAFLFVGAERWRSIKLGRLKVKFET